MASWNGSIVFFGVSDLEAVDAFYRDLLGLPLYKDQGLCRIYRVPGGGKLGFCNHVPITAGSKSPIITLLTEDVDALYETLCARYSADIDRPAVNEKFRIYHFFTTDPHGYTVEIQKFLD